MSTIGGNRATPSSSAPSRDRSDDLNLERYYGPKIKDPDTFSGRRSDLRAFLMQLDIYFSFHENQFSDDTEKVMYAASYLRGAPFDWFSVYLDDHIANEDTPRQRKPETSQLLDSYSGFKERMSQTYGDIDEVRVAEQRLHEIRQRGTAMEYTAEFQRNQVKTNWGEAGYIAQYYRGLVDRVKDDIVRGGRPTTLQGTIEMAIEIDNRHWEREQERKGRYQPASHRINRPYVRQAKPYYGHQPMELDAVHQRKELSNSEKERRSKERLCFTCGKPGHQARNCGKGKSGKTWPPKKQLNTATRGPTRQPPRMQLNSASAHRAYSEMDVGEAYKFVKITKEDFEEGTCDFAYEVKALPTSTFVEVSTKEIAEQWEESSKRVQDFIDSAGNDVNSDSSDSSESEDVPLRQRILELENSDEITEKIEKQLTKLRQKLPGYENGNIAEPDHPRHAELAWGFCYTKSCRVHEWNKNRVNIWPFEKSFVYWPSDKLETEVAKETKFLMKLFQDIGDTREEAKKITTRIQDFRQETEESERNLAEQLGKLRLEIPGYENGNVAETDHPRHAELNWRSCYTDSCEAHYERKDNESHFPGKHLPVYWTDRTSKN
jgi:hypothetical protein